MSRVERNSDRRAWLLAWVVALALHAALFLALGRLPPLAASKVTPRIEPVRLIFAKPGPAAPRDEKPHTFTELPSNRADQTPKRADFLSNVTSRARDRVPGGEASLPRAQGDIDAPLVKLEKDGGPARVVAERTPAAPPREPAPQRASESPEGSGLRATAPVTHADAPSARPPDVVRVPQEGTAGGAGTSDIDQPEMANPSGNAPLAGDVSLNTIAWDYAPWLQRFGRQLMRRWAAPTAYSMGMLKEGGWAVVEVEISRSGQMLRLELLEQHGHVSLIQAAESALRSMSPIERLPSDFPEPTLILRIRMIYPKVRPR